MLQRTSPTDFIGPCLPTTAERPPSVPQWVHARVHLLTRNGHNWSARFPLILEAASELRARPCLIDGEAVCGNEDGLAVFERLCRKHAARTVSLYAFDLLEVDGVDLRHEPIETRKATLASLLRGSGAGIRLNEHFQHAGDIVFRHACKCLEGIVSKRLGSRYRSGRSKDWLKFKNPDAPAVRREAEEDWSKERRR